MSPEQAIHAIEAPGDFTVRRTMLDGYRVVEKSAEGRQRTKLRYEAAALRAIGASSLTELVRVRESDTQTVLVCTDAGTRTLACIDDRSALEILRILRSACAAVRDLHQLGWSHGNLAAEHFIIGSRARVRICSASSASPLETSSHGADDDIRALMSIIESTSSLKPHAAGLRSRSDWRRSRRRLVRLCREFSSEQPSNAESLVDALQKIIDDSSHARTPPARRRLLGISLAAATVVLGVLVLGPRVSLSDSTASEASATTRISKQLSASSPGGLVTIDGITYRIGAPTDRVVVGDWDCVGDRSAILLRPSTGELFSFPEVTTDGTIGESQPISVVPNALELHIGTGDGSPDGRNCDTPIVELDDGSLLDPRNA